MTDTTPSRPNRFTVLVQAKNPLGREPAQVEANSYDIDEGGHLRFFDLDGTNFSTFHRNYWLAVEGKENVSQ